MGSSKTVFAVIAAVAVWGVDAFDCGTGGRRPLSLRTSTLLPASLSTSAASSNTIPDANTTQLPGTTSTSGDIAIFTSTTTSATDVRTSSDNTETALLSSSSPLTSSESLSLALWSTTSSSLYSSSSADISSLTQNAGSTTITDPATLLDTTTSSSLETLVSSPTVSSSPIFLSQSSKSLSVAMPGTATTRKPSDSLSHSTTSQSSAETSTSQGSLVDPQTLRTSSSTSHSADQSQSGASHGTTSLTTASEGSSWTSSTPGASRTSTTSTTIVETTTQSQQGTSISSGSSSVDPALTDATTSAVSDASQSTSSLTIVLSSSHYDAVSQGTSTNAMSEATSTTQTSSTRSSATESHTSSSTTTSVFGSISVSSTTGSSTTTSITSSSSTTLGIASDPTASQATTIQTTSSTASATSTTPTTAPTSIASQTTASTSSSSTLTTSTPSDSTCKDDEVMLDGDFEVFSDHWTWSGLDDPHRFGINRRVVTNVNSSSPTSGPHNGVGYLLVNMNPSSTSYTLTYNADTTMDHGKRYAIRYYWASVRTSSQSWTCSVDTIVHGTNVDELTLILSTADQFSYKEHEIIFTLAESKSTTNIEMLISCSSSSSVPVQLAFDDFSLQEYCSQTLPMSQTTSAILTTTTSSTSEMLSVAGSVTSRGTSLSSTSAISTISTSSTTSPVTSQTTTASSTQTEAGSALSVGSSTSSTESPSSTSVTSGFASSQSTTTSSSTTTSTIGSTSSPLTSDTTSATTSTTGTSSTLTSTLDSTPTTTSSTDTSSTTTSSTEISSTPTSTTDASSSAMSTTDASLSTSSTTTGTTSNTSATDPTSLSTTTSTADTTSASSTPTTASSTSTTTTSTTGSGPTCATLPLLMGNPSFEDENIGPEAWSGIYSWDDYPVRSVSSTSADVPRAKSGDKFLVIQSQPGDPSPNHGLKRPLSDLDTSKMYQIRVSVAPVSNPDLPVYSCGFGFVIGGTPVAQTWISAKSTDPFAYTQYTGYFRPTASTVSMEMSMSCVDLNNGGRLWPGVVTVAIDDIVLTEYSAPCAPSEGASSSSCGVIARNIFTQQYGVPFNLELCAQRCVQTSNCQTFSWDADNKKCYTSIKALKDISILAPIAGRSANVLYDRSCFQCPDCPGPPAIAVTPDSTPTSATLSISVDASTAVTPSTDAVTSSTLTDSVTSAETSTSSISSTDIPSSSTSMSTTDSATSDSTTSTTTPTSSTTPAVDPAGDSLSTTSTTSSTSSAPPPDRTCGWEYVTNGGFEASSADSDPWSYDASRDTIISTGSGTQGPLTGTHFAALAVSQATVAYGRHISQTLSQMKAGKQYLWKYNWATFGWTGSGSCTLESRVNSVLIQSRSISSTNQGSYNEVVFLITPTSDSVEIRFDIWCASNGIRSQFRAASLALDDVSVTDYCPSCVADVNSNAPKGECGIRAIGTTTGSAVRMDAASLEICAEKCRKSTAFVCKTVAFDDTVVPGQCFLFTDSYQDIGVVGTGGGRFAISNIDCYVCAAT